MNLTLRSTVKLKTSSQVIDGVVTLFFFFPESEVLFEELDDTLGITEVVLLELVNLVEGILQGLISESDSFLRVLLCLIVEHGEVESKAEFDRVAWGKFDLHGSLVRLECFVLSVVKALSLGVLSHVAVVVSYHLHKEALGLAFARLREDSVVDNINDTLAIFRQRSLDGALVRAESICELLVLGVLLDSLNSAASGAL